MIPKGVIDDGSSRGLLEPTPPPVTQERAEVIRLSIWNSGGWTYGDATTEEVAAIKRYWETLPGTTSFYDAVTRLARGG